MRNKNFYYVNVKMRNSKELHPYINYRIGVPPYTMHLCITIKQAKR